MDSQTKLFRESKFVGAVGVEKVLRGLLELFEGWTEGKITDKKFVVEFFSHNSEAVKWLKTDLKNAEQLAKLAGFLITEGVPVDTPMAGGGDLP